MALCTCNRLVHAGRINGVSTHVIIFGDLSFLAPAPSRAFFRQILPRAAKKKVMSQACGDLIASVRSATRARHTTALARFPFYVALIAAGCAGSTPGGGGSSGSGGDTGGSP